MPTQGVKEKSGWDSAAHFALATGKRAAAFGSKARHVLVLAASALALRCPFARLPLVPAFRCLLVIVGQSKGLTGGLAPHASAIAAAPGPSSTAPPAAVAAASSPPKASACPCMVAGGAPGPSSAAFRSPPSSLPPHSRCPFARRPLLPLPPSLPTRRQRAYLLFCRFSPS